MKFRSEQLPGKNIIGSEVFNNAGSKNKENRVFTSTFKRDDFNKHHNFSPIKSNKSSSNTKLMRSEEEISDSNVHQMSETDRVNEKHYTGLTAFTLIGQTTTSANQIQIDQEQGQEQVLSKESTNGLINKVLTKKRTISKRLKLNKPTKKDIESLSEEDKLIYDKRDFKTYLKELLLYEHDFLSLIFTKSLMEPIPLRISHFFFTVILNFAFNAIFYEDEYITERADYYYYNDEVNKYFNTY